MPTEVILVLCTCPDDATGARIAETLVGERLAACVNRVPGLTSVYLWEGNLSRDQEMLLLIKTTRSRFDRLAERLRELHPYELPEIIATPVTDGAADYLQWVSKCTADDV
jgi:periplasmic divalent cation tolerance protein